MGDKAHTLLKIQRGALSGISIYIIEVVLGHRTYRPLLIGTVQSSTVTAATSIEKICRVGIRYAVL